MANRIDVTDVKPGILKVKYSCKLVTASEIFLGLPCSVASNVKKNKYSIRLKIIIIHTAVFLVAILDQAHPQLEGHWAEAPLVCVEVGRMVIGAV